MKKYWQFFSLLFLGFFCIANYCRAQNADDIIKNTQLDLNTTFIKLNQLNPMIVFPGRPMFNQEEYVEITLFISKYDDLRKAYLSGNISSEEYDKVLVKGVCFFDRYDSYASICLANLSRRLLLENARKMMKEGNISETASIVEWTSAHLPPTCLSKDGQVISSGSFEEQLTKAFESWGYHGDNLNKIGLEVSQDYIFKPVTTHYLLMTDDSCGLLFLMMLTERQRRITIAGSLEFLRRKGDIAKLEQQRETYFDQVFPKTDVITYKMPLLGIDKLTYFDILQCLRKGSYRNRNGDINWSFWN